jgi:Ran GTPase-activating protein (RanGAP) involved in mRNA processing and transport
MLNLRGCGIHETLMWFYLSIIDKYSPEIKLIDISGNHISSRVCEVVQDILEKMELKSLKMANVDLRSKGLATICLGLAKNTSLIELDLNYNNFGKI